MLSLSLSEWQYLSIVYEKNSFYSWSVFDNNWLIFSSFIVKIGQFTLEPPAPYRLWYVCVFSDLVESMKIRLGKLVNKVQYNYRFHLLKNETFK